MNLRCAILDDYQNIALTLADWSSIAEQVDVSSFHEHFIDQDSLINAIKDFDIIIIMRERTPFSKDVFSRLPKLKLLITTGMRNASVDLIAAENHQVTVCGTNSLSQPPTELAWALILGLARNIVTENIALRSNGAWQSTIGMDLHGKQLGLLGLGKIGSQMARIGLAFGMNVLAWSQNLTKEKTDSLQIKLATSKEHLLNTSDFVSIHLILSDRTKNLIDIPDLKQMKPKAYLVNTSRAQIVNQAALITALENKWIAGAGIDVFDSEPLPSNHPFRTFTNVLATPHLGYVSLENYRIYYQEALENIKAFLKNQPIRKLNAPS